MPFDKIQDGGPVEVCTLWLLFLTTDVLVHVLCMKMWWIWYFSSLIVFRWFMMFDILLPLLTFNVSLFSVNQEFSVVFLHWHTAPAAAKVPANTQPRLLQDEGFYVGTRPHVTSANLNRMENRLLKEAGVGHVTTDEEASAVDSESNRVSSQLSCYSWTVLCVQPVMLWCKCMVNDSRH